ncbi:MAG TPA: CBS domain-containing protein [Nitrosopumilaceae archaeon]|nr:CBS domain-containing protein [Nitrosopumilaceae archaeon]
MQPNDKTKSQNPMKVEQIPRVISDTKVADIMTRALISVNPSTTIFQVAKMMEMGGFGAIIVKEDNLPKGIITDRDFAIKIAVNKYPLDTPVHKIASYPLQTISSNESILAAADLMSTRKIRKLVVVDDGKVVGIITSTDIVNQLAKMKND